jgi:hypothetical protein
MRKRHVAKPFRGARASDAGNNLSLAARALMLQLLAVLKANNAELPNQMLNEIDEISLEGVDRQWQIDEMEKILYRYMRQH